MLWGWTKRHPLGQTTDLASLYRRLFVVVLACADTLALSTLPSLKSNIPSLFPLFFLSQPEAVYTCAF